MPSIRVRFDIKKAKAKLKKKEAFIQRKLREKQRAVAFATMGSLKSKTPSVSGKTRAGWNVERARGTGGKFGGGYSISNNEPTMIWLEDGTKAHGPVRASRLYIPRSAAGRRGYKKGLKWGKDFVLAKRVKGIKAHNIVSNQLPTTRAMLLNGYNQVMRSAKRI